jgi:hypothetical protein
MAAHDHRSAPVTQVKLQFFIVLLFVTACSASPVDRDELFGGVTQRRFPPEASENMLRKREEDLQTLASSLLDHR